MNLIRTLFSRLSESLLSNGSEKFGSAAEYAPASLLRLVSDKPVGLPSLDPAVRRPAGHTATQPDAIDDAIRRSQSWFLSQQHAEGYWVAELEADTTLTSEYLMLRRFLDRVDVDREQKAVHYLKSMQLPDGGWPIYYGGPSEISASVKAYFALKLSGVSADEPFMVRAKERILAMGGVVQANVFTKIALALFDQYDWEGVPHMPVEIMLLPKRFYFSIYAISYWSRAVLIPLLIIFAHRPVCRIPREQGVDELYLEPREEIRYWKYPPAAVRRFLDTCGEAISRFNGYIAKYMGDGLLVYFGYPHAHEHDAERAVHAGLAVLELVKALPRDSLLHQEFEIAVRIGIATGSVIVGELIGQDTAKERSVFGETPNLAARLQGLAAPNQLIVDPVTKRLVGGEFECVDGGTVSLKGFETPVHVWQVLSAKPSASRFESYRSGRLVDFIGREHETALVLSRWREAVEGEGQVVLLGGEAGIGKSRLPSWT